MVKFRGIVFEVDKDGAKCVADIIEGDDRQVVEDHTHARGAVKLSRGINVETMVEELGPNGQPVLGSVEVMKGEDWLKSVGLPIVKGDPFNNMDLKLRPGENFTLKDHPRKFLRSRAARLVRLLDMDAPTVIVEGEFRLIEQAMVALRELEGDKRYLWEAAKDREEELVDDASEILVEGSQDNRTQ